MRAAMLLGVALVLTGCGRIDASPSQQAGSAPQSQMPSSEGAPPGVIVVSADSEIARMIGSDVPAIRFVASESVAFDAGTALLWEMSTDAATDDEAAALAEALGIDGQIRVGDAAIGETHAAGSFDSAAGQLSVFGMGEPTWRFQTARTVEFFSADVPAEPATPDVVDAAVDAVMAALGVTPGDLAIESLLNGPLVEVSLEFAPDGSKSDVFWALHIGPDGTIVFGEGHLRAPTPVGEVRTVDLDDALLRSSRVIAGGWGPDAPALPTPTPPPGAVTSSTGLGDDGSAALTTAPVPTLQPLPVLPTITGAEAGLISVWDIANRTWLVPAIVVSGDNGFTNAIPIISSDHLLIADPAEAGVPVRTGPPLTVSSTTSLPWTGPTLPRPTNPVPAPTLLTPDGTPMTLPIPPDPNEMSVDQIPDWYREVLNSVLVGRSLDEAVDILQRTGWMVRIDDLDSPTETADAGVVIGRATVEHRSGIVVSIRVG